LAEEATPQWQRFSCRNLPCNSYEVTVVMASTSTGSCIFLFGAGASAFSSGVTPKSPPLGNRLFEELCEFDPYFGQLDQPLKDEFRGNFESGMARFHSERLTELSTFLCRMSLYFLQFKISQTENNIYCRVVEFIQRVQRPLYLATLNYDLLLEHALLLGGCIPNWQAVGRAVLKLHGSPIFLVGEETIKIFTNVLIVNKNPSGAALESTISVADPDRAREYCKDILAFGRPAAPAISAYVIGKNVPYNPSYVKGMQQAFANFLTTADSIVLVGINLNEEDSHIWDPIAASPARIGVVNPDFKQYTEWGARRGRNVELICEKVGDMLGSPIVDLMKFVDGSALSRR
jgi:hypothetical protein